MTKIPVQLAVEDELSELILRRLLSLVGGYAVGRTFGRGGLGYLKHTLPGWNNAAPSIPFIVLTDLDDDICPISLMNKWLQVPKHPNLLFRVAVREVESWLLADANNFAAFIGRPVREVPLSPDLLSDPKGTLVELASRSRFKEIRTRIAPRRGSTAKQGPDYNSCLGEFVAGTWDAIEAAEHSQSLARTITRLRLFSPVWQ